VEQNYLRLQRNLASCTRPWIIYNWRARRYRRFNTTGSRTRNPGVRNLLRTKPVLRILRAGDRGTVSLRFRLQERRLTLCTNLAEVHEVIVFNIVVYLYTHSMYAIQSWIIELTRWECIIFENRQCGFLRKSTTESHPLSILRIYR